MPSRQHRLTPPAHSNPADEYLPAAGSAQEAPSTESAVPTIVLAGEIRLFLDFARVEKGLAANSIAGYRRDLTEFSAFLSAIIKVCRKSVAMIFAVF